MTAKNNKRPSIPGDRYYTPDWAVQQCMVHVLPVICLRPPKTILEPSAGTGAFLGPLRKRYDQAELVALDIDPVVGPWIQADHSETANFLEWSLDDFVFDLTIGNPPFTHAREFCERALSMSRNVVYLVRQGFLASARRLPFWRANRPSHIFTMANRPNFDVPPEFEEAYEDADGDSADYCFVCWSNVGQIEATYFDWLPSVPLEVRKGEAT